MSKVLSLQTLSTEQAEPDLEPGSELACSVHSWYFCVPDA